jgi:hypothetical protein
VSHETNRSVCVDNGNNIIGLSVTVTTVVVILVCRPLAFTSKKGRCVGAVINVCWSNHTCLFMYVCVLILYRRRK